MDSTTVNFIKDSAAQAATVFNAIINKTTPLAERIMESFVKRQIASGITDLIISLLFLATIVAMSMSAINMSKRDHKTEDIEILIAVLFIVSIILLFPFSCYLGDGLKSVIAPEAQAIMELIENAK